MKTILSSYANAQRDYEQNRGLMYVWYVIEQNQGLHFLVSFISVVRPMNDDDDNG